jgi:hypothetical protein
VITRPTVYDVVSQRCSRCHSTRPLPNTVGSGLGVWTHLEAAAAQYSSMQLLIWWPATLALSVRLSFTFTCCHRGVQPYSGCRRGCRRDESTRGHSVKVIGQGMKAMMCVIGTHLNTAYRSAIDEPNMFAAGMVHRQTSTGTRSIGRPGLPPTEPATSEWATTGGYHALESTHVCNTPFRLLSIGPSPSGPVGGC